MKYLLPSWFIGQPVAWLALAISAVTLILKLMDYRTKIAIPNIYVSDILGNTQKIILVLSNESAHPISITELTLKTGGSKIFKPKFGNFEVWSDSSYEKYTDILPVTLASHESKLLMFEIDNSEIIYFSKLKVSTVTRTFTLRILNQDKISVDTLTTIR